MPDYSKGKIYTIRCRTDDSLIYVGSTIQSLPVRFGGHKRNTGISLYKYISNPENNTDWSEWYIELHELYPCDNKMELCKREGEVIREIATINKYGYYIDQKDYREKNKEAIKDRYKQYREENTEVIKDRDKQYRDENKGKKKKYREENKEAIKDRYKQYYEENKEKIKQYREENKEKRKKYRKAYYEKNKEMNKEMNK